MADWLFAAGPGPHNPAGNPIRAPEPGLPRAVQHPHRQPKAVDTTRAAYAVGYESVCQFNREYSRFFGQPPMRDRKALRAAA